MLQYLSLAIHCLSAHLAPCPVPLPVYSLSFSAAHVHYCLRHIQCLSLSIRCPLTSPCTLYLVHSLAPRTLDQAAGRAAWTTKTQRLREQGAAREGVKSAVSPPRSPRGNYGLCSDVMARITPGLLCRLCFLSVSGGGRADHHAADRCVHRSPRGNYGLCSCTVALIASVANLAI